MGTEGLSIRRGPSEVRTVVMVMVMPQLASHVTRV